MVSGTDKKRLPLNAIKLFLLKIEGIGIRKEI